MDADVKPDCELGMGIPKLDPSEFKKAIQDSGSSSKQLHIVDDSGYRSFDSIKTLNSGQDEDFSKEETEDVGEPVG